MNGWIVGTYEAVKNELGTSLSGDVVKEGLT